MTGTTTYAERRAALEAVRGRYQEIAPPPTAGMPGPALAMASWLTLAAQRAFTRCVSPYTTDEPDEDQVRCAYFGMLHVLDTLIDLSEETADHLAGQILGAWGDARLARRWLWEYGGKLGVDTVKVAQLANREACLEAGGETAPVAVPAPGADDPAAALSALEAVTASHARVMFAAAIDLLRGDPDGAARILREQLDGWAGPAWNGTDTGMQWLSQARGAGRDPAGATAGAR